MYLNNDPGGVIMQFCNDGWSEKDISLVLSLGGGKKKSSSKISDFADRDFQKH